MQCIYLSLLVRWGGRSGMVQPTTTRTKWGGWSLPPANLDPSLHNLYRHIRNLAGTIRKLDLSVGNLDRSARNLDRSIRNVDRCIRKLDRSVLKPDRSVRTTACKSPSVHATKVPSAQTWVVDTFTTPLELRRNRQCKATITLGHDVCLPSGCFDECGPCLCRRQCCSGSAGRPFR
jgi:hypothetical protein